MGEAETRARNIGEFHLDTASGQGWTYRMYLTGPDSVRVDRVHPDPTPEIAEVTGLRDYDQLRARFTFPSTWDENGNSSLAETAIINAFRRIETADLASSIRFGDTVFEMTAELGTGVRVTAPREGVPTQWVATLTALHKPTAKVQMSWNAPDYGDVFGTDPRSAEGRAARLRLAAAAQALWRSAIRHDWSIPVQRTAPAAELVP